MVWNVPTTTLDGYARLFVCLCVCACVFAAAAVVVKQRYQTVQSTTHTSGKIMQQLNNSGNRTRISVPIEPWREPSYHDCRCNVRISAAHIDVFADALLWCVVMVAVLLFLPFNSVTKQRLLLPTDHIRVIEGDED